MSMDIQSDVGPDSEGLFPRIRGVVADVIGGSAIGAYFESPEIAAEAKTDALLAEHNAAIAQINAYLAEIDAVVPDEAVTA